MSETRTNASGFHSLNLYARLALVCALGCVAGVFVLRWVFWRDLGVEYAQAVYTLKSMRTYLIPTLALSSLIVLFIASVAVFLVAIFFSHRVAGPLFRLQRVGEHLDKSILIGRIVLRDGDWLGGVADRINAWVDKRKATHIRTTVWSDETHEKLRDMKILASRGDYVGARALLDDFLKKCEAEKS